jgi:hypothetical protein
LWSRISSLTVLFIVSAPLLPAKIATRGLSFSIPSFSLAAFLSAFNISLRIGFPVKITFCPFLKNFSDSLKLIATLSTNFARILFVTPGKAFCS